MLNTISPTENRAEKTALTCRVAVVGGGFTGASIARFLALEGYLGPGGIVVFEPRPHLGAGLAYDTEEPLFRLNVTAQRMRAIPDDPLAFLAFLKRSGRLEADPDSVRGETIYARRADFGAFMQAQLQPYLADGRIVHVQDRVAGATRSDGKWHIESADGRLCRADSLVTATGHPTPNIPAPLAKLNRHPLFITNPNLAFGAPHSESSVLVIGAGLTALDVATKLDADGHRGPITLICRSGLLPGAQLTVGSEPYGDFLTRQPQTARTLLHAVRLALKNAGQDGRPWQNVFDALRQQGQALWRGLPPVERRRFLRHLRRRFETHRHRMPPQNAEMLERLTNEGRLSVKTGEIREAEIRDGEIALGIVQNPGMPLEWKRYGLVVLATGADHASSLDIQPWLADLAGQGYLVKDELGLGIACDQQSRALSAEGQPDDSLFIAGPLARGQFGELTGVPEIALQAQSIARHILRLNETADHSR